MPIVFNSLVSNWFWLMISNTKEIKRLGIKKIVYVDAFGKVNKKLSRKYHTDYICPGYKELARLNIKSD